MARINIEDAIFKENRYTDLCIAAGSRRMALGALTELWIEAQKFYLTHGEIPIGEWVAANLPEYLITTGWAERTSTGVRAKGQDAQFAWLRQAKDAGVKSANARKEKNGTAQPPSTGVRENVEPPSTNSQPPYSLLLSPSSLLSSIPISQRVAKADSAFAPPEAGSNDEAKIEPKTKRVRKETGPTLGSRIFESYAQAYRSRWKTEPLRNAGTNTMAKRVGEALGEDAIEVAAFYVWHNKAFYVSNCHAFKFLLNDAQALNTQWATGKQITRTEANAVETKQQVFNAFAKYLIPEGESNGD